MADVGEITGSALQVARKAKPSADGLKSPTGMAAVGAALIALPYAAEGIAKLTGRNGGKAAGIGGRVKEKAAKQAKDIAGDVADEKLGSIKPSMPKGLKGVLGGGSGDEQGSEAREEGEASDAHGSGRRMPIQQSVDVAVPIKDAYNLWTQFENWPEFMHRVDNAEQVDDVTVAFTTKVWGINRRSEAQIMEQRPDERIEWDVKDGLSHSGVVTFHKLAPRLTRIELTLDVKPEGLVEKAGRGMRFTKRAARGDLHRFKAFAEMEEHAEEGWRGTIEGGEVKRRTERRASRSNGGRQRQSGSRGGRSSESRSRSHS